MLSRRQRQDSNMGPRRSNIRKVVLLVSLLITDLVSPTKPIFNRTVVNVLKQRYSEACPYTAQCTMNSSKTFPGYYSARPCCLPCSCDNDCVDKNTCCIDKIPDPSYDNFGLKYGCFPGKISRHIEDTGKLDSRVYTYTYYYMVNVCTSRNVALTTASKCVSPNDKILLDNIPVTSSSSGITYRNRYCAACTDVTDAEAWTPYFSILHADPEAYDIYETIQGTTADDLLMYANEHPETLSVDTVPPAVLSNQPEYCLPSRIRECNVTGLWETHDEFVEAACAISGNTYRTYGNIFCLLCNTNRVKSHICPSLDIGKGVSDGFTSLINYENTETAENNDIRSNEDGVRHNNQCEVGELFDEIKGGCRPWFCPYGYRKMKDDCEPLLRMIYGMNVSFPLTFTVSALGQNVPMTDAILGLSIEAVEKSMSEMLKQRVHVVTSLFSFEERDAATSVYTCLFCVVRIDAGRDAQYMFPDITRALDVITTSGLAIRYQERDLRLDIALGSHIVYNMATLHRRSTYDAKREMPLASYLGTVLEKLPTAFIVPYSRLIYCKQVELFQDEYKNFSHKICLIHSKKCLFYRDFQYFDNTTGRVRICAEDYLEKEPRANTADTTYERIKSYLSVVLSVISGTAVLVVMVTILIFKDLCRPITGKNNLMLCLSLLATTVLYHVQAAVVDHSGLCFITGILTHFSRMATFCWFNVGSFHLLKVFTTNQNLRSLYFIPYTVVCFIIPLIVVGTNAFVSYVRSRGSHYGYGGNECFISSLAMIGLTVVAPAGLGLVVNVILYARIVCTVSEHHYRKNDFTQGRINPLIYLQVCSLAVVTCMSDFLFRLTAWYPLEVLCLIARSGEGLLIFIALACHGALWNMYKILLGF